MKRKFLAAGMVTALLSLAACGEDGSSGADRGPEVTGDPIVIGTVGGFSGNQAGSQGLLDDVQQVWADHINHNGGINGHPVKLVVKDDANDPAKALQAVKELVEEEHVVAIVGHQSLVSSAWIDYATEKNVPIVGGPPVEATSMSSPIVFPIGANVPTMIAGQFVRMKEAWLSKMGITYCAESPVCASLEPLAKGIASVVAPDLEVAYAAKISATQPSYSAECLAAKKAGVDALFPGVQAPAVIALADGCSQVGFDPREVAQMTVFSKSSLESSALDGSTLVSPTVNYLDESNPTVKEMLDAVRATEESMLDNPQFTVNTIWPWMSSELFKKAAEAVNLSPTSTSADVFKGIYALKDETLGGAMPPTTYAKGQPTFVSCWYDMSVKDGAYVSDKNEPSCLTQEQLAGIQKILSAG